MCVSFAPEPQWPTRRSLTVAESDAHYHPPPRASRDDDDVAASCLRVTETVLVARAVHQLWRAGYERETTAPLNDATNPA